MAVLGHRHPRVMAALRQQLDRMTFAPPLHGTSDVTLELVEKLGSVAPGALKFVKPYSGGSESIESALKFVRQYFKQTGRPGKYKVVSCYGGYHGSTFGAMGASGTGQAEIEVRAADGRLRQDLPARCTTATASPPGKRPTASPPRRWKTASWPKTPRPWPR